MNVVHMLLGSAAVVGSIWAVFNYFKTRRYEAAKWLNELFREFYIEKTFKKVRLLFEYHYSDTLGPLIERRITDRQVSISKEEQDILTELDTLLNYFEHVLYLEEEQHLRKNDRLAVFEYWFGLLSSPSRGGLRVYISKYGYERIAKVLDCNKKDYLALYGSLMRGFGEVEKISTIQKLEYKGSCNIPGSLYDLGEYPGLVPDDDSVVVGELYVVKDSRIFREFDIFERYDPNNRKDSLYVRSCIRLREPKLDAWVYIYNKETSGKERIYSGDWRAHQKQKETS